jgi:hypothetical protein
MQRLLWEKFESEPGDRVRGDMHGVTRGGRTATGRADRAVR